jgi:DivIVA domain-containing protein
MSEHPTGASMSPNEIRSTHFSTRLRGYEEHEVNAFCEAVATQVQRQSDEIERLRGVVDNEDVKECAVALFSQAQTVADQLIAEAVEHAQDLMLAARGQQREVLQHVRDTAQNLHDRSVQAHHGGEDLGHVQTYAQIAAVQLRAVIDALAQQVDRLDEAVDGTEPADARAHSGQPRTDDVAHPSPSGAPTVAGRRDELADSRDIPAPDAANEPIWASMMPAQTVREPGW